MTQKYATFLYVWRLCQLFSGCATLQAFAGHRLGTKRFVAKIKDTLSWSCHNVFPFCESNANPAQEQNVESQKLFEGLGYRLEKHVEIFQEIHYMQDSQDVQQLRLCVTNQS